MGVPRLIRAIAEGLARPFGVRIVSAQWGPRGFSTALLRLKQRGFRPGTIVDIGASNGTWSRECLEIFPDARYALFDALRENAAALNEFAAAHKNAAYWIGTLGSRAAQSILRVHGDQSSIYSSSSFPGRPRPVEMRPLDSFIREMDFRSPLLIKADVQGYEIEIIRGASDCLAMTEVLLLEVSFIRVYEDCPLAHEVVAEIGKAGFRLHDICSYVQRPADGVLAHGDLMFIREGSSLIGSENWF